MRGAPGPVIALSFVLGLAALVAVGVALGTGAKGADTSQPEQPTPGELLPDLDQEAPTELGITESTQAGRRTFRLGFASAVINVGAGPLIIHGSRNGGVGPMRADQLVRRADGSTRTAQGVAALRYVRSSDHAHWHLVPFERYELRRPGASASVARDAKTGFCLGDRYDTERSFPGKPPEKVFRGRCGLRSPYLVGVREGISVGYGDDYDPNLEGQSIELTGLAGGRYVLVHSVNSERRLQESDYSNNAASLLLQLRWRGATPLIETLRICPASAECQSNSQK